MKKKSDVQIGDEREEKFRDLRISQGYLSQKRNRAKFKKNDLWKFDVISMNKEGIEFAQVKGQYGRGAEKRIKEWIKENRDRIPENVRFTMAYYTEELGTFRTVDIPKSCIHTNITLKSNRSSIWTCCNCPQEFTQEEIKERLRQKTEKAIDKCGWEDNKGNCSNKFMTPPYCIGQDECVVILLNKQRGP